MFGFSKKEKTIEVPKPTGEELVSLVEIMHRNGLASAIEHSIKSTIDSAYAFQMQDNDQGNYFGSEFNIRANSARLKGAYIREPWMNATANLLARTLASIPFVVEDKATNQVIQNHPLLRYLEMGNGLTDSMSVEWTGGTDLVLSGNFFRVFNETYTEVMYIPTEKCTIGLSDDKKSIVSLNIWDDMGRIQKQVPWRQVVHHKYPNPFNPYYGMSMFVAASRPIILDRFKNEFEMAFYLRGATNAGVIETTEDINKSRMARLLATFEQAYTGKRNWFRTIFLPKGAKWISSGLTMSEMQHLEGMRENRKTILAVLGIPPSKVGIIEDVNRSTSEVQDKTFYENTIVPLAKFKASGWNNSYLVKVIYGGRVRIVPDLSNIEALQGSAITKGEESKAMEPYFWIDEIRKRVWKTDPLPNNAGQKFTAEVRAASPQGQQLNLTLGAGTEPPVVSSEPPKIIEAETVTSVLPEESDTAKQEQFTNLKSSVISNQEKLENKFTNDFEKGYKEYLSLFLTIVENALTSHNDVKESISKSKKELAKKYSSGVSETLERSLERGFSFALSQTKNISEAKRKNIKAPRFTEIDQQAIDALRQEELDGQRSALAKRSISNFVGMNDTRTDEVLDMIADGLKEGESIDTIARTIRQDYGEKYPNQSSTIARTEVLSAISQGINWNHDVLKQVFTEVKKQWFHVGDSGSNPNAREEHVGFEELGQVSSDYKYGGTLSYPRDPNAPAKEIINCRCSLISVVPDSAQSNAEVILDRLL